MSISLMKIWSPNPSIFTHTYLLLYPKLLLFFLLQKLQVSLNYIFNITTKFNHLPTLQIMKFKLSSLQ